MNPMSEAWNLLKSNIEERSELGYTNRDGKLVYDGFSDKENRNMRQKVSTLGLDPDDVPRQVPHAIRQRRKTTTGMYEGNRFVDGSKNRDRGIF